VIRDKGVQDREGGCVGGESYIEKVVDEVSRGRKLHTKEVK